MVKMSIIEKYRECDQSFKNREEAKAQIRRSDLVSTIITIACFLFAALGVIGDAFDVTLVLESMSWFLLAIVAGLIAIIENMHLLVAKHLLGIEAESKKE
jgi:hypothetical protein